MAYIQPLHNDTIPNTEGSEDVSPTFHQQENAGLHANATLGTLYQHFKQRRSNFSMVRHGH
jgi:hypothetical protein